MAPIGLPSVANPMVFTQLNDYPAWSGLPNPDPLDSGFDNLLQVTTDCPAWSGLPNPDPLLSKRRIFPT
jgi:hypothetical protein